MGKGTITLFLSLEQNCLKWKASHRSSVRVGIPEVVRLTMASFCTKESGCPFEANYEKSLPGWKNLVRVAKIRLEGTCDELGSCLQEQAKPGFSRA